MNRSQLNRLDGITKLYVDERIAGLTFSGGATASGSSGTSGTSGTSGVNGSSGTSGADGGTGSSGTSGVNGSSGTSGTSPSVYGSFGITIDGGGSPITTGVKGYVTIPYSGTITGYDIFSDITGSIIIDVWKDTYATFPPSVADSITGSEKPSLTSATKAQDNSLTTWITSVTAGDIIGFNVDDVSVVTRVNLIIKITKS